MSLTSCLLALATIIFNIVIWHQICLHLVFWLLYIERKKIQKLEFIEQFLVHVAREMLFSSGDWSTMS